MRYHLAQANVARFKAPLDSPIMKEFVDFLEPVNRFAEESQGFIWRLTDDEGRAASYLETPFKDEMMAINISLWEGIDSFKGFVYGSVHSYFLKNKKKWFDLGGTSLFVMWWIPVGVTPTLEMAKAKLEVYERNGDTSESFTFKKFYDTQGKLLDFH